MNSVDTAWSVAENELLAQLWADGKSASEIMRHFASIGFKRSRNGVIGRVHRMGLATRSVAATKQAARMAIKPVRKPAAKKEPKPKVSKARAEAVERNERRLESMLKTHAQAIASFGAEPAPETATPLVGRKWSQCAWPVDADNSRDMRCCGAQTAARPDGTMTSYCRVHFLRSASIIRHPPEPKAPVVSRMTINREEPVSDLFSMLRIAA